MAGGRTQPKYVSQSTWHAHARFRPSEPTQITPIAQFLASHSSVPPAPGPTTAPTSQRAAPAALPTPPHNLRRSRSPSAGPSNKRHRQQPITPAMSPVTSHADGDIGGLSQEDNTAIDQNRDDGTAGIAGDGGQGLGVHPEEGPAEDNDDDMYLRVRTLVILVISSKKKFHSPINMSISLEHLHQLLNLKVESLKTEK